MKSMKKLVLAGLVLLASVMILVGCKHEVEPQHAHTGGTATCTTKAKCSECGAEYGVLNPENHENEGFTYTDNGDGTHTKKTMCCKVPVGEVEKHTGGAATCITKATCSECGFEYRNPENHEKDELLYTKHVCCEILEIDGTLGGKTEATDEDINALVEQLKAYVDNGITTIIVTGEEPAMYNLLGSDLPAVSAAIFFLGSSGSETHGDLDSPYCGTIDLIMPDATSLAYMEFCSTYALNSVTLPKVIKIGDEAFHGTWFLKTLTFGSVLTEVNETGVIFAYVGNEVGGCDLILNCGQMNESSVPAPDLTTNTWGENEFKSITLTHTGECDECKANQ